MPNQSLAQDLLLPELHFIKEVVRKHTRFLHCEKRSSFEVCPKCATPTSKVYDHVTVTPKDAPIRSKNIILVIRKRRFRCVNKSCKKIFREYVPGVYKGFRTTARFRSHLREEASTCMNLKRVKEKNKCSSWLVQKSYYEQIELELRKQKNPWPKTIGIDEHAFLRSSKKARTQFVTVFIDYNNRRMKEVVLGKAIGDLHHQRILNIEGRENVKNVILDLSPTFRSFALDFFPRARLIADKFHVVKLMHPLIHELRKKVMEENNIQSQRRNPIHYLLLKNYRRMSFIQKRAVEKFLALSSELTEAFWFLQRLYWVYRIKGHKKARERLIALTDDMARSKNKRIRSYRETLHKWTEEILNYFSTNGLNNGRTEGYNRKAKLIQRCAYGFRSFENYRLKLLYSCR